MKGIILAGGTGSRLYPLTKVTNKHLLPVGKYPMIFHSIYKLKQAGIHDILIVTGKEHMGDVVNLLGSGTTMNVSFTYKVQDEAGGIAQALGLAEQFVGQEQSVVILGDNVFEDDITPYIQNFRTQGKERKSLSKRFQIPSVSVFLSCKRVRFFQSKRSRRLQRAVMRSPAYTCLIVRFFKLLRH